MQQEYKFVKKFKKNDIGQEIQLKSPICQITKSRLFCFVPDSHTIVSQAKLTKQKRRIDYM